MVLYKTGDLFDYFSGKTILVHGCNAQHVMGGGIALQVRRKFPQAYYDYMATPKLVLGDVIFTDVGESEMVVANAITQEFFGNDHNKRYASTDAIYKSLLRVRRVYGRHQVIMPEIGCGLGGLSMDEVKPIIESVFDDDLQTCIVVTWDKN